MARDVELTAPAHGPRCRADGAAIEPRWARVEGVSAGPLRGPLERGAAVPVVDVRRARADDLPDLRAGRVGGLLLASELLERRQLETAERHHRWALDERLFGAIRLPIGDRGLAFGQVEHGGAQ